MGRYGVPMSLYSPALPGGIALLRAVAATLSWEARLRLQWMDFYARRSKP